MLILYYIIAACILACVLVMVYCCLCEYDEQIAWRREDERRAQWRD